MSFVAVRRDSGETMAAYDDRPISVYDNLNMPPTLQPSTGIHHGGSKSLTPSGRAATSQPASTDSRNGGVAGGGAAQSVFADLTFRFNDNNNSGDGGGPTKSYRQQQQQQFAGAPPQQHTLPSIELQSSLPNGDNPHYSHPYSGGGVGKQVGPPAPQQHQQSHTLNTFAPTPSPPPPPPQLAQPLTDPLATPPNARISSTSPVGAVRPLSQHSQSEPNETSQNIAAVKAALNDAKSKFFGLNGYSSPQPSQHMSHSPPPPSSSSSSSRHQPLLDDSGGGPSLRQVQIVPPKPPQPKYQNIPENSAIFRTPPELPPKPKAMQPQHQQQSQQPASDEEPVQPAPKILPYGGTAATMYQQIPLNDIDAAQPSQAVYMTTTVPQNIKGSKIAGRHTPTRNSLRHSRMLVINNKNYQVVQHPNPMNFKQPNLARWLLILQIIIGLLIGVVAAWTFILAASTPIQDNPFWSSLALIAAGSLGLSLVRYQRIKRHKARENCFLFMRANSFVLSLLAVLLCSVAWIYASIHYMRLIADDTSCVSSNVLLEHGSCLCSFHVNEAARNQTLAAGELTATEESVASTPEPELSYQVQYRDFSCSEVLGIWVSILRCSMSLNALGFVVSLVYILLLACYRYDSKRMYSSVHVSSF